MAVKITNIDWRSSDSLITQQENSINTFLTSNTVADLAAVDEFLIAVYVATPPASPWKIKIFKAVESIFQNGINSTETAINNFLQGKTLVRLINLDSGTILVIYI